MDETTNDSRPAGGDSPPRVRRKRYDRIADAIRVWIMEKNIRPGDRLPPERELMQHFKASKGTMREALKALELQGLIRLKTGPNGGPAVAEVTDQKAIELLGNYFYSQSLSLADVYAIRKTLEPQLAEAVCGHLSEAQLQALAAQVDGCSCAPEPEAVRAQRMAELDFHEILAEACPNALLAFYCRFVTAMLKNLTVCQAIYETSDPHFTEEGQRYHAELLEAFRAEDPARARQIMYQHMLSAERAMLKHEAVVRRGFLFENDEPEEPEPDRRPGAPALT